MSGAAVAFRFDPVEHEYLECGTGEVLPHITGLLETSGWVDSTWMTEESSIRGQAIHQLTAEYDQGALHVPSCVSEYRGYLLGHVEAVRTIQPRWLSVEVARVHRRYRFGGRPDRTAVVYGAKAVLEGKSGQASPAHAIQTALQAILVAEELHLPAEAVARFCLYWRTPVERRRRGLVARYVLERHDRRQDFDEAYRILKTYACGSSSAS